jgi:23S rRNA (uracil1939-C5)-methyltransferase
MNETERQRPTAGDVVELRLESLGHGGEAVGRSGGFVYFVERGAPGDRVRVVTTEVKPSFARASIQEILAPSPHRVDPKCPHFGTCGGCHLQHLSGEAQLESRVRVLRDALERIARIPDPEVAGTVSGSERFGYRHRITLHAETGGDGDVTIGFVDRTGSRVASVASCDIAHPRFAPLITALQEVIREPGASGRAVNVAGRIEIRTGYPAREAHVFLSPGTESLASPLLRRLQSLGHAEEVSLFWQEGPVRKCAPHAKPPPLRLETAWATWHLPPGAFYQVNPEVAIQMAETVRKWAALTPDALAVDLYAGIGFIAATFAADAKRIWCLEGNFSAVRAGEAAMRRSGYENVRFVPGAVEARFPTMRYPDRLRLVVLDPPREGVALPVIQTLLRVRPQRIIYVSCEPSTLARDLKRLLPGGYRHVRSTPFDLFPQTYHVESVTLLEAR